MSTKLSPEVGGNGEYLIVHNFAGRRMRGFKVTEQEVGAPTLPPPPPPTPVAGSKTISLV